MNYVINDKKLSTFYFATEHSEDNLKSKAIKFALLFVCLNNYPLIT
jgi:hypothetical protein